MLFFLWWFVVGPVVGWVVGRLMRSGHNGWLDALAGLIGAILIGTICDLVGFSSASTPVDAMISGVGGALIVSFLFGKLVPGKSVALPGRPSARSSYTSYKSRMGK